MIHRRNFLVRGAGLGLAASIGVPASRAATATPIIVGQSAALTGPQAGFGTAMRDGIKAALQHGQPRRRRQRPDHQPAVAGRPGRQGEDRSQRGGAGRQPAGRRPHRLHHPALFRSRRACWPPRKASPWSAPSPARRCCMATRPPPPSPRAPATSASCEAIVHHYRLLGAERFGFVHLEDARATNVPLLESILAREGGKLIVTAGVDRKGPGQNAAAIKTLEANEPEVLIILANNAPLTGFLREYAPRTLLLPKMVISFVDREKLLADLGKDAPGVGFSVVVPEYTREKYTVVRDFLRGSAAMKITVTPVSLEGYITGLALVEGLRQARNDTRAGLIEGMARVGGARPGLHQHALHAQRAHRLALRRPVAGVAQRRPGLRRRTHVHRHSPPSRPAVGAHIERRRPGAPSRRRSSTRLYGIWQKHHVLGAARPGADQRAVRALLRHAGRAGPAAQPGRGPQERAGPPEPLRGVEPQERRRRADRRAGRRRGAVAHRHVLPGAAALRFHALVDRAARPTAATPASPACRRRCAPCRRDLVRARGAPVDQARRHLRQRRLRAQGHDRQRRPDAVGRHAASRS